MCDWQLDITNTDFSLVLYDADCGSAAVAVTAFGPGTLNLRNCRVSFAHVDGKGIAATGLKSLTLENCLLATRGAELDRRLSTSEAVVLGLVETTLMRSCYVVGFRCGISCCSWPRAAVDIMQTAVVECSVALWLKEDMAVLRNQQQQPADEKMRVTWRDCRVRFCFYGALVDAQRCHLMGSNISFANVLRNVLRLKVREFSLQIGIFVIRELLLPFSYGSRGRDSLKVNFLTKMLPNNMTHEESYLSRFCLPLCHYFNRDKIWILIRIMIGLFDPSGTNRDPPAPHCNECESTSLLLLSQPILQVATCQCHMKKTVTSFLPELDQLTDQSNQLTDQPTDQLTNLRDTELRLLLATEKNLPFQIAVDMDRLEEMQLTSS